MKNNLMKALTLSALLFSGAAAAEHEQPDAGWVQKPVQCASHKTIIDTTKKFGEIPVIVMTGKTMNTTGILTDSKIVVSYNKETKSWTLVEFLSPEIACILNSGEGMEFIVLDKGMSL